ncbi:MAG: ABC transporter ATP-binding protein, partial [uncultured bacterium]
MVAIVGPSGSGKSTTMNILGLLDKPTSGKYYLDNIDTSEFSGDKLSELRNERLGFIFQQYFLLPKLTAIENVILPLTYRHTEKISMHDIKQRAMTMLKVVG